MKREDVFGTVGYMYLRRWGDSERAAELVSQLADARASLRGGGPTGEDVFNVMYKLCDWIPNKPQDYQIFIGALRPLLVADPDGPQKAKQIFTEDFLRLDFAETLKLFGAKMIFFVPNGTFKVVDNSKIPPGWVKAPFDGFTTI
jgi:hypothetical protein